MVSGAEIAKRSVVLVEADQGDGMLTVGAGVLLDLIDFAVTNHHVVAGAKAVFVVMQDGRRLPARLMKASPGHDVAGLRLEGRGGWPMPWGDDQRLQPGDRVHAVGNPGGRGKTISSGVVLDPISPARIQSESGVICMIAPMIVANAPTEPGNSGGALCDDDGRFLGLVTGGGNGTCLAIPARRVRRLAQEVLRGIVPRPGLLGISLVFDPTVRRYVVDSVTPHTPAAAAGLRKGDIIVGCNGFDAGEAGVLAACLRGGVPGDRLILSGRRGLFPFQQSIVLG